MKRGLASLVVFLATFLEVSYQVEARCGAPKDFPLVEQLARTALKNDSATKPCCPHSNCGFASISESWEEHAERTCPILSTMKDSEIMPTCCTQQERAYSPKVSSDHLLDRIVDVVEKERLAAQANVDNDVVVTLVGDSLMGQVALQLDKWIRQNGKKYNCFDQSSPGATKCSQDIGRDPSAPIFKFMEGLTDEERSKSCSGIERAIDFLEPARSRLYHSRHPGLVHKRPNVFIQFIRMDSLNGKGEQAQTTLGQQIWADPNRRRMCQGVILRRIGELSDLMVINFGLHYTFHPGDPLGVQEAYHQTLNFAIHSLQPLLDRPNVRLRHLVFAETTPQHFFTSDGSGHYGMFEGIANQMKMMRKYWNPKVERFIAGSMGQAFWQNCEPGHEACEKELSNISLPLGFSIGDFKKALFDSRARGINAYPHAYLCSPIRDPPGNNLWNPILDRIVGPVSRENHRVSIMRTHKLLLPYCHLHNGRVIYNTTGIHPRPMDTDCTHFRTTSETAWLWSVFFDALFRAISNE